MARKKIREYDAKRLLKAHIKRLAGLDLPIQVNAWSDPTRFSPDSWPFINILEGIAANFSNYNMRFCAFLNLYLRLRAVNRTGVICCTGGAAHSCN